DGDSVDGDPVGADSGTPGIESLAGAFRGPPGAAAAAPPPRAALRLPGSVVAASVLGCADSPRAVRSGDPARLRARVAVSLAELDCDGPALVEDPASPEASESAAASGSPAITPPTPSATARAPTRPT
ncbi:MAG: hypothetical protein O3A42_13510, partial [Actinobacteria bacterium]|nr:hypothetical protein [Actinomycetota bacterium]